MTHSEVPAESAPPVPESAWALALLCLGDQFIRVLVEGRGSNMLLLSMLLGIAIVLWASYGVLTARTFRFWLALILMVFAIVGQSIIFLETPSGYHVFAVVISVLQLIALWKFSQTAYFQWQRRLSKPSTEGLQALLLIAVLVGAMGGYIGADGNDTDNPGFHVNL